MKKLFSVLLALGGMKSLICFILILTPILSGCSADRISTDKEISMAKSDFVLIDGYNFYLCNIDTSTNDIEIIQKISSPKNKMGL
ncbi:MAG: hypothetical protein RR846_10585, partial [Oscillospiraceae bacterium]